MSFIKKNRGIIITVLVFIIVLAVAFFGSGEKEIKSEENIDIPEIKTEEKQPEIKEEKVVEKKNELVNEKEETIAEVVKEPEIKEEIVVAEKDEPVSEKEETITEVTEEPEQIQEIEIKEEENTGSFCTLSVRCDTAIGKNEDKSIVIPDDGVIFAEKRVEFNEGESVFDVLFKQMKENKIHLEFVNIPLYKSAYIEGIGNLYEFDCGELSGWMYKVNGWFPNYGSSGYTVKKDDKIEWVYTCDLGKDVGGEYSKRNGFDNE